MHSTQGQPFSNTLESVLEDVGSALRKGSSRLADVGALLALYGSIMSLSARAKKIIEMLGGVTSDDSEKVLSLKELSPAEVSQFSGFFEELLDFGERLTEVSLAAIDIYYPGLKDDLLRAVGCDLNFSWYYTTKIAPAYGLLETEMPATLIIILDKFDADCGPQNPGGQLMLQFIARSDRDDKRYFVGPDDDVFYPHRDIPTAVFVQSLLEVFSVLEKCRKLIATIVKEHWDFRELTTQASSVSVNIEGGIQMPKTQYNVSNSQVGAVGPNANLHDVRFSQQFEGMCDSIDLKVLADQLVQLKAELASRASERDHYLSLAAVCDASIDARAGNGRDALAKLVSAGKWALDVATKIGAPVASAAIKGVLGIKE